MKGSHKLRKLVAKQLLFPYFGNKAALPLVTMRPLIESQISIKEFDGFLIEGSGSK